MRIQFHLDIDCAEEKCKHRQTPKLRWSLEIEPRLKEDAQLGAAPLLAIATTKAPFSERGNDNDIMLIPL